MKTKKKSVNPAQKPQTARPLSKATTAELTAVLVTRGLRVVQLGKSIEYPVTEDKAFPNKTLADTAILVEQPITLLDLAIKLDDESNYPNSDYEQLSNLVFNITGEKVQFIKELPKEGTVLKMRLENSIDVLKQNHSFLSKVVYVLNKHLG